MSEKTEKRRRGAFLAGACRDEIAPRTQKGVLMRRLAKLGALVGVTMLAMPAQAQLNGAHV